jgi:molybdopterin/thiamine biosynthesis adenylyltransferase
MTLSSPAPLTLTAGRFERFARVEWWDQSRLRAARVLVIGAGALGNEVVKNLSLVGVGHLAVADMDRIEESNLSRSALFSAADEGRFKAEVICQSARRLFPDIEAIPLVGNVLGEIGLGWFRWAEIVVGALDNREARVYVNSTCAMLNRPWIDGGIDMLNGIVRGFAPPATACYECTMNQTDWDLINKRRSCSLLARRAMEFGGAPTSPTTASVIGAMQAQEVIKHLHGLPILAGAGYVFEGRTHGSYSVDYQVRPDCPWHEASAPVEVASKLGRASTLRDVWELGAQRLGPLDALDLTHEIVTTLVCSACHHSQDVFQPINRVTEAQAICPRCKTECQANVAASVGKDSPWLDKTVGDFGLPAWDIVWARGAGGALGLELAADRGAAGGDNRVA